MRILVATEGRDLNAKVSDRFGRCPYFIVYDTDSKSFDAIKNPGASLPGGAGNAAVQEVVDCKAEIVLCQKMGPKAGDSLKSANIPYRDGFKDTVKEAINMILAEKKLELIP